MDVANTLPRLPMLNCNLGVLFRLSPYTRLIKVILTTYSMSLNLSFAPMLWIRPEKLQLPFEATVYLSSIFEQVVDFWTFDRLHHDHLAHARDVVCSVSPNWHQS